MSHSLNKVWIHAIWATKERLPLISFSAEQKIYDFMYTEFEKIACNARIINGMPDHIHCLFLLNAQKSVADVIKQIKGSTSHHINTEELLVEKFSWQTGYAAYSVSESQLEKVYQYIKNQKQHHLKKSFEDEYNEFLKKFGFESN
ncbi:MAG: IS200/IS605 family transposase [Sphingobacteriales bacterium]|jgi:putative transposase|nr:MAG: IS200/IS605 family transposase [Sphingobacteriales bacterium]